MLVLEASTFYPNRLALVLGDLQGPVTSFTLGDFDPRRDSTAWVGGSLQTIESFTYDAINNRYLIFLAQPIDLSQQIQLIHHMPLSPFRVKLALGFAGAFGLHFAS